MKKIAIIAQKGGVGKTAIAVNLAVATGKRLKVALFDLDSQESAVIWSDYRKLDTPHVEFLTERRLSDAIKAAEVQDFDLIIIDTPPAAGPQAFAAAQTADLILIPCKPSRIDLDAIRRTAQLIKSVGIPSYAVLNAARPSATTLLDEARAIVKKEGLDTAPVALRERSAYRASWPQGKAVAYRVDADVSLNRPSSRASASHRCAGLQVCASATMPALPTASKPAKLLLF